MQFIAALLTPFDAQGRVDHVRLRAHTLWLMAQGVDGFAPTGTTGEFLYLSTEEKLRIHQTVLDAARGRPVYPCTWDPSPRMTIKLTEAATAAGATAVFLPPPLYYNLSDENITQWYGAVRARTSVPILGYHHPGHLPSQISPQLYRKLRQEEIIVGLKDSSRDLDRLRRMVEQGGGAVFAGGDRVLAKTPDVEGIVGFISAAANAWPKLCVRIFKHGETQLEQALLERLKLVRQAGGIPALKSLMGMSCRAPLFAPSKSQLRGLPAPEKMR